MAGLLIRNGFTAAFAGGMDLLHDAGVFNKSPYPLGGAHLSALLNYAIT